jgi:4-hydroxy-tetrahydrodipicolinate reductase
MLGNILLETCSSKTSLVSERLQRKRTDQEIHISSLRGGTIPGIHTVYFDSSVDTIELTHRARSREGFAIGAVKAASWIADGRKGFFTLDDMMEDVYLKMENDHEPN